MTKPKQEQTVDAIIKWSQPRGDLVLWETPNGPATLSGIWRITIPTPRVKNPEGFQPHEYLHPLAVGQAVFIEVPAPTYHRFDFDREHIAAMRQARVERVGGLWIVAHSVADVEAVLGGDHGRGPDRGGDYDPIPGRR